MKTLTCSLSVLLAISLLLAGCGSPYASLVEGGRAYFQGDLPAAKAAYAKALKQQETEAVAHLNLGQILLDEKDYAAAKLHLDEGLRGHPGWALGHLARAEAELGLGADSEGETDLRKAVALDPGLGRAWLHLARLEIDRARPRQALDALSRAKADVSLQEQATLLALPIHRQLGEEAQSIAELEALSSARPSSARVFFELGELLLRQGDYERAERHLTQGLALEPDSRAGRLALARSLQGRGRWDLAGPQYQAVVDSAAAADDPLALQARNSLARRSAEKKF